MLRKPIPLIVILGPTASGKSAIGIGLAGKFSGEIVSADSRQIYRGMEIGAGTVTEQETAGIPHHLLSFRSPRSPYAVRQFQRKAIKTIEGIARRGAVPFLVGGTGFWIDAVCQNISFPDVKPDPKLRRQLSKKTAAQLSAMLKKLDPAKARAIDPRNPHRLIRAIEIAKSNGAARTLAYGPKIFNCLYIGVDRDKSVLQQKIRKRFGQWLRAGFLDEVRDLIKRKIPRTRFKELGLHYWLAYQYLHGSVSKQEFVEQSITSIWHYAKRQMTWFRRNKNIRWVRSERAAQKLVNGFLETS